MAGLKQSTVLLMMAVLIWGGMATAAPGAEPGAAPAGEAADASAENGTAAESETEAESFQRWAFFPVLGSSTETGLQFGALAVRFFEPDTADSRTSTITFLGYASTEGQYHVSVAPDFYFDRDTYHFYARLKGEFWPDKFYGIGNDSREEDEIAYESTSGTAYLKFERRFWDLLYAGAVYRYANETIDDEAQNPLPGTGLTGAEGGVVSGLGYTFSVDRRDNINDARTGMFAQLESIFYDEGLGSDFRYAAHILDLRQYFTPTAEHGIALRGYLRMTRGVIPFQALSSPNGYTLLRGIEAGRYRDRDMAALQAEWRYPIYWRFGGTAFVETAQVADELTALRNDGWKLGGGLGLRFALNPKERFNVRLDVSYVDGGVGVTLGVREAF